jgi:hypothetical protein
MKNLEFPVDAFLASESGAITVDWVFLSGMLVGLSLAATMVVSNGMEGGTSGVAGRMGDFEISQSFPEAEPEPAPFERNQWTPRTGGVAVLEEWMAGFTDENLLAHMNNQAQFSDGSQTGHPYDTYHDEYWVARDEAITRGLIEA